MPGKVVMLLDNHYAPDRRVEYELALLTRAALATRVVAWDRRSVVTSDHHAAQAEIVRFNVPAPPGGGVRSGIAMLKFAWRIWKGRAELLREAAVLVVHDIYLLPLGWFLSRIEGLPLVYDAHEEYARMEATRYSPRLLQLVTAVETLLARRAECIVVPGNTRVHRWSAREFDNVVVLRNIGLDTPPFTHEAKSDWDILHAGTLSEERRLDLLLELARTHPDIKIAVAGSGRLQTDIESAAAELPNVSFLGWRADLSDLILRSRSLYYGLDPTHPDAETACPNTLYQALRHKRPIIFFRAGEIDELSDRFRISVRAVPSASALAEAVEEVRSTNNWEFDAALESLAAEHTADDYVNAIVRAMTSRQP